MKENSGRRQAQRLFKLTECAVCGGKDRLCRHHKNQNPLDNSKSNIAILCYSCHLKIHYQISGKSVQPATCAVCGELFMPERNRNSTICGNPSCKKELGRASAEKRWSGRLESKICEFCGKLFSPKPGRFGRSKTCSRTCGNKLAWKKKKENGLTVAPKGRG